MSRLRALLRRLLRSRIFWVSVATLALATSATGWKTYDYVQHDPAFCTNCHSMSDPHQRWATSPHREVDCRTCHPGELGPNLHQLWAQVTKQRGAAEKHAAVDHAVCASCHLSKGSRWKQIGQTKGHNVHVAKAKIDCTACHAAGMHIFQPAEDVCTQCHHAVTVGLGAMAELHCLNCHDYLGTGERLLPGREQCTRCHQEGGGSTPVAFGGFGAQLPLPARLEQPASPPGAHSAMNCMQCHRPHGHVEQHGLRGPGHPAVTLVTDCGECHEKEATRHGSLTLAGPRECGACHEPHEAAGEAVSRCVTCHSEGEHAVAASARFEGGHDCTGCHASHEFTRESVRDCRGCHQGQRALAADRVREHADCTSCHAPHDVKSRAERRCITCHAGRISGHASRVSSVGCTDCHDPHPPAGATTVAGVGPCSSCHDEAISEDAFHMGNVRCTSCHEPHAAAPIGAAVCGNCHGPQASLVTTNDGHDDCRDCHEPHHPARAHAAPCRTCHRAEASTAPAGHADCKQCHEPHSGSRRAGAATCLGCHAERRAALHADIPGGCQSCHRAHGPEGRASPPACTTCHATARLPSLHQIPAHQNCSACHSGHADPRSDRATCVACHEDQRRHEPNATRCSGCHAFRD